MNYGKAFVPGLIAGLAMAIVGAVLNLFWQEIFPSLKAESATLVFRPEADPLFWAAFICPVFLGLVMAYIWQKSGGRICFFTFCLPSDDPSKKDVLGFATTFIIMALISLLMTYSSFSMSFLMFLVWCDSVIIQYFLGTWILAKMIK